MIEARTMSKKPARSATRAMISSGALPNVALSSADGIAGPRRELLGRLNDEPGNRHDRQRRREEQDRRGHGRTLQRERHRDEDEQPGERWFERELHDGASGVAS